jgi:hypothetical protein
MAHKMPNSSVKHTECSIRCALPHLIKTTKPDGRGHNKDTASARRLTLAIPCDECEKMYEECKAETPPDEWWEW